jgi:hypothetical protein
VVAVAAGAAAHRRGAAMAEAAAGANVALAPALG